ncbi:MAG: hypothetical protein FJ100_20310 [Deltaproteobacteria bacterium]|nr:hypothetical protein [Deltaproteobacteria bacterium]
MTRYRLLPALFATLFSFAACEDKPGGSAATADTAPSSDTAVAKDAAAGDGAASTDTQAQAGDAKADGTAADTTAADVAGIDTTAADTAAPDTAAPDTAAPDTAVADVAQDVAAVDAAAEVAPGNPCVVAGGTVETQNCCKATADFPNLCAIGACGCSPDNSKATLVCKCPDGKCFDGKSCVKM